MCDYDSNPITVSDVVVNMSNIDDSRYKAIEAIAKALEVLARQVNSKSVQNNTGINIRGNY